LHTLQPSPNRARGMENSWILLSDSTRLAARVAAGERQTKPGARPSRRHSLPQAGHDGATRRADASFCAGCGHASLRVDRRGIGNASGLLTEEYLAQTQDDGVELLRWIAGPQWCNGSIGMIGTSWGGFDGLQFAARRPPELKAVIIVCASDDRCRDDIHYWAAAYSPTIYLGDHDAGLYLATVGTCPVRRAMARSVAGTT
jgi:predicted acyl esterase